MGLVSSAIPVPALAGSVPLVQAPLQGWTLMARAEECLEKGSLDGFTPHPLLLITSAGVGDGIQSRQGFEKGIK